MESLKQAMQQETASERSNDVEDGDNRIETLASLKKSERFQKFYSEGAQSRDNQKDIVGSYVGNALEVDKWLVIIQQQEQKIHELEKEVRKLRK